MLILSAKRYPVTVCDFLSRLYFVQSVYSYFAVALAQAGLRVIMPVRPITVAVLVATQRGG